mgnify:CR=1 FL=1
MRPKSMILALLLAVFLGPIGLIYATPVGGVILLLVTIFGWPTVVAPIGAWILSIIIAPIAVIRHNDWAPKTPPQ